MFHPLKLSVFHQIFEWKHEISVQIWPWTNWIQFIRYLPVPQWSSFHWKLTLRPNLFHINLSMYGMLVCMYTDQFCTCICLWLPYGNGKFRITFRYLNIYVSIQKFPQTFIYRSKKYCERFKSFGELGKKYSPTNCCRWPFRHWRKIAWLWLPSTQTNLFSTD